MRASPLARRPIASKKSVPQVGWRAHSQQLLVELVRRFGLPSRLCAGRDGIAKWSETDLEGLPLQGICLKDTDQPVVQMRAGEEQLNNPEVVAELAHAFDIRLHTNGSAVRAVHADEHTCLAALAIACATAQGLFSTQQVIQWDLLTEWSLASHGHTGYRRTLLLLAYALSNEEDKTFAGFEQFIKDFDLNVAE